jgi:uncharacterized protein
MIVYLDSMIVIYAIEGPAPLLARAKSRLGSLVATGDQAAISDLTRLECRVKPIRHGDAAVLADFDAFFTSPNLLSFALPAAVFERATLIRAAYGFGLGDSPHLSAAIENRCGLFLTNDTRLSRCTDIPVEVLS